MSVRSLWSLHGLVVGSEVELDARPAGPDATPNVTFTLTEPGPVPMYGERLVGDEMAHIDHGASALSISRRVGGPDNEVLVDVCFHGIALATVDCRSFEVAMTLAPYADPGLASVLICGTLMSVVLTLKGHPVLHASAVVTGGGPQRGAIAVVGRSGMGKSTLATLLCRDGAELLADDVLRTDLRPDGTVVCWPGSTATRLRPAAESLAREAAEEQVSTTADGRFSASLAGAPDEAVPLRALVVPYPDRGASALQVQRLSVMDGLLALISFPRILGWTDQETSGAAHRHWGELARSVPVMSAVVPWGPPFEAGLGSRLVARVGALEEGRTADREAGG